MVDVNVEAQKTAPSPEAPTKKEFSLDVEIEGRPFIFKGSIPEKPDSFALSIHVPDWQQELEKIKIYVRDNKLLSPGSELTSFSYNDGEIAYIDVTKSDIADLYIQRIRSSSWILPPESKYHETRGLGRFLMNNLLTLADIKRWSITAFPYTDGKLTDDDVRNWLLRKSFAYDKEKGYELIRRPQSSPDMTQAIAHI